MKLFVDTWGWVAIADRRDLGHDAATEIFRRARHSGGAVTSNFILDETLHSCSSDGRSRMHGILQQIVVRSHIY